jgi:hypothetical protein
VNIFDYEDSLSRWLERAARDHEQLQRVFEQSARHFRAIESSPAFKAIDALQRQLPSSSMAEVVRQQESIAKALEPLRLLLGDQFRGLGDCFDAMAKLDWPRCHQQRSDFVRSIKGVFVTQNPNQANQYLQLGWVILDARLSSDGSSDDGAWMLGWPHDEAPKEPDTQE